MKQDTIEFAEQGWIIWSRVGLAKQGWIGWQRVGLDGAGLDWMEHGLLGLD